MDANTAVPIYANPVTLTLFVLAIAAFIFGVVSMIRAWRIAGTHPPFAALGRKRWMMGYAALPYMPQAAMLHVKRHFFSTVAVAVCLLAMIAVLWMTRA